MAIAAHNPNEVHIYDLVDGAWTRTLHLQDVNNYAVRLSPNGQHLAVETRSMEVLRRPAK